ncbi:hypothetical protein [Dactylosporangium sp. CA-092794]|uniref:hypothetical protein n=1 Tax=Dactylosporangium sp. CA-092794 TaxID=3239929 RepID=UPI003D94B058
MSTRLEHAHMTRPTAGRSGAATVLLGTALSLVGITWDVQWHVDVGPDTFFTLPHLLLYSGSAVSGLASLAMVLAATAARRAGRDAAEIAGGPPVRALGVFTAPLGYLVSGVGAASFLLYGLIDLYWHSVYGFDATLASPPHIALFSAITVTMVGAVIVYGSSRHERWGRAGLLVSLPILMMFSPITTNAVKDLPLPFDPMTAGTAFFGVMLLVVGLATVGRPGTALGVAAVLGVMQAALWLFAPFAAHAYAGAVGLPLRDNLGGKPPELPAGIPMFLLLAAAALEGVLWLAARRGWSPRWAPSVGGALAGLIVSVSFALQGPLIGGDPAPAGAALAVGALAAAGFGALGAFLGWRFAGMLRGDAEAAAAPVPGPSLAVEGLQP